MLKEPLIESGRVNMRVKSVHFTVPPHPSGHSIRTSLCIKARIAGSGSPIAKIRNTEVGGFRLTATVHESIRGSLNHQRGFTLLEVLVALAVLAVAMGALVNAASSGVDTMGSLREQTFASWVAQNQINELAIADGLPTTGNSKGSEAMAGRNWFWRMTVSKTDDADLRRIEVSVFTEEKAEYSSASLVGFKGRF